ncbi:acyl-CoA synthetase [Bordetella trematum]|nr:acyl-CoA synthetase [Bordetella trematum]
MWPAFKGLPFVDILSRLDAATLAGLRGIIGVGDSQALHVLTSLPPVLDYAAAAPPRAPPRWPARRGAGVHNLGHHLGPQARAAPPGRSDRARAHGCGGLRHRRRQRGAAGRADVRRLRFFNLALRPDAGATLVSLPVFEAAATAAQIRDHGVTHTFANNEFIDHLLQQAGPTHPPYPRCAMWATPASRPPWTICPSAPRSRHSDCRPVWLQRTAGPGGRPAPGCGLGAAAPGRGTLPRPRRVCAPSTRRAAPSCLMGHRPDRDSCAQPHGRVPERPPGHPAGHQRRWLLPHGRPGPDRQ